jgi:hypothetical protein
MLRWLLNGMARVSAFTVHEPPQVGGTKLERAERLLFVGDGFSWRAALLSPFYLLVRGEWLALAAYTLAALLLAAILKLTGAGDHWFVMIFLLLNVVAGFEASELKRWSLARAGWQEVATVSGRGQEEAERRFFDVWLPTVPAETERLEPPAVAGPFALRASDATSRVEAAVRRLSERLRSRFATGP